MPTLLVLITTGIIIASMNAQEANDLFAPALQEYKELKDHYRQGYFFSGSGSSFFKVKENEA